MHMVDPHIHVDALNHHSLEMMATAGITDIISMVAIPEVNPEDKKNVSSDAIFEHCDRVISYHSWRTYKYFLMKTHACVCISMVGIPVDYKEGMKKLREYLREKSTKIVGIGEIGLEPTSIICPDLRIQEEVFIDQLQIAKEFNKPISIHTPPSEKEKWVKRYISILGELKLDPGKVIIDHADPIVTNIITEAGYYAAISVQPWRKVRPEDAAIAIKNGNLHQIMVDSDCSLLESDPLAVPKTALEMRRLGMREVDIEQVLWDNPKRVYDLP
jgi:predicted metal-dependent TIM-barrel fold hydrolase